MPDQEQDKPVEEIPKEPIKRLIYIFHRKRKSGIKAMKTYFKLMRYVRPYWYLALTVLILTGISSFTSILPTQVMGVAINEIWSAGGSEASKAVNAVQNHPQGGPLPTKSLTITPIINKITNFVSANWMQDKNRFIVTFVVLALTFLFLHLFEIGISVANGFIMTKLGNTLTFDMRNHVYDHLQRLSLRFFEDRRTGDLMSRAVNDVDSLQDAIVGPVIWFITDMIRLFFVLYLCISWDWELTVLSLLVSPLLIIFTVTFGIFMKKRYYVLRQRIGDLNAVIQDNLSGIRIIKGFAREDYELGRFKITNDANRKIQINVGYLSTAFSPIIRILMQAGSLIVLLYGGIKVYNHEMTPGMFVVFFPYVSMLYGPIMGVSRFFGYIIRALASVDRVFEVLDSKPEVADKDDAVELPAIRGEMEFKNVCFSYVNGIEVLKDVSFKSSPGQMVAFVGPSGAGKTTAINMVARFYDPNSGDIFVDGYNLKDVKQKSLRSQMGIVLQDPFLFNDTVKINIAYGKIGASDEDIIEAAKAANAHDFIMELQKGYDTVVGERGVKLSGGQKQRVSIARAILANPRILILDEATSSVDTETEFLIQTALQRLVKDRTTFVIAHRLSTVHSANLIVVFENGKIIEMGKHQELIAKNGLYSRLYKIQFKSMPAETEEDFLPDIDTTPSQEEDSIEPKKIDEEPFKSPSNSPLGSDRLL
ncbi:MAG: ATP-binding cassette, subfamily bacterial MsbA [Candidatus Poribacteria bacterium]|nr:ATP-binding cassette, subfamily bacterial MsbA [Candidatus Poribacteria bacterium]